VHGGLVREPDDLARGEDQELTAVVASERKADRLLAGLLAGRPGPVLDLGCGTGIIARRLVEHAERVDALDVAPAMLAEGKRLPNGDHPRLRWMLGRAEDAPLGGPYALVTAAATLHWMDWTVVLPRLRDALTPDGLLVIIVDGQLSPPWHAELLPVLAQYSTNQEYQVGFDLVTALKERGLLDLHERRRTAPVPFRQSVDAYVESFHARSGCSRARMEPQAVVGFDEAVRAIVSRYGEVVELQIVAGVAWGRPRRSRPADE
jgi:SAM-dependent methyltransferase